VGEALPAITLEGRKFMQALSNLFILMATYIKLIILGIFYNMTLIFLHGV